MYKAIEKSAESILRELEARFPARFSHAENGKPLMIAIDGRCGSGKTTLASLLREKLEAAAGEGVNLFHMDDFYLRREQRTEERLREPGGNVDRERFLEEVLMPLAENRAFSYRPITHPLFEFKEPVFVEPAPFAIIEGSYSCHPELRKYYDLRVFLTIGAEEQKQRILRRNGEEKLRMFEELWIPLEELYFSCCGTESSCDLVFDMSDNE